jgi:hypothetical protein
MSDWQVVLEVRVARLISRWARRSQMELDAIQRLLRADGPAGLDWSAHERAGFPAWEAIEAADSRVFHAAFEDRIYRLTLEIRPGRTIVVRQASHFISPFGRGGGK